MVEKLDRTLEQWNEQPETKKETEKLKTKLKASTAAALLALTVSVSGIEQNDNVNTQIPGSEVLEEVERKWVWDRISEWIKSMLAKWVDFVIPSAHANPFEEAAEDDSRWEDDWKESRDSYQETREERKQAEEELEQSREELEQSRERAQEVEEKRIEYTNEMISLVNQLWIEFDGELEEKRNEIVKYWTQENLSTEKVKELNSYLDDILDYINSNY